MLRTVLMASGLTTALVLSGCGASPHAVAAGPDAIAMDATVFRPAEREIPVGATLTFTNTSARARHILAVGRGGAPYFGRSGHRSDVGETWTTPPWTTPGSYRVTCTVHAGMTMRVTVVDRR